MKRWTSRILPALLGMSILIGPALPAHAVEPPASEVPVPEALQRALATLWQELAPHIERSRAQGHSRRLVGVGWRGKPYLWQSTDLHELDSATTFLIPLRSVIEHASCHGHPKALKSLFRLSGLFTGPFLTLEHRLLLEWRALHLGLKLPFLGKVRWNKPLPQIAIDQRAPTASDSRSEAALGPQSLDDYDLPESSPYHDHYRLFDLSGLLRDQQFDDVLRRIPELAKLCFDIAPPEIDIIDLLRSEEFRYDPIELPKTAG